MYVILILLLECDRDSNTKLFFTFFVSFCFFTISLNEILERETLVSAAQYGIALIF